MIQKLKIINNSPVTITIWKWDGVQPSVPLTAEKIIQGTVIDAVGNTIKVKFTLLKVGFLHLWRTKWFSLNDAAYKINIKNIDNN